LPETVGDWRPQGLAVWQAPASSEADAEGQRNRGDDWFFTLNCVCLYPTSVLICERVAEDLCNRQARDKFNVTFASTSAAALL
jgi:hypothetical protein